MYLSGAKTWLRCTTHDFSFLLCSGCSKRSHCQTLARLFKVVVMGGWGWFGLTQHRQIIPHPRVPSNFCWWRTSTLRHRKGQAPSHTITWQCKVGVGGIRGGLGVPARWQRQHELRCARPQKLEKSDLGTNDRTLVVYKLSYKVVRTTEHYVDIAISHDMHWVFPDWEQ